VRIRRSSQRTQPVAHRVVAVTLCRSRPLRRLRQLINVVVAVVRRHTRPVVCLRCPIPRIIDGIRGPVDSNGVILETAYCHGTRSALATGYEEHTFRGDTQANRKSADQKRSPFSSLEATEQKIQLHHQKDWYRDDCDESPRVNNDEEYSLWYARL